MNLVTKTTGRLHFEDLDPSRFEDLCLSIVYRMRRWVSLDHLGRLGSDGGVDIRACEQLENGKNNIHHFQCKRYQKMTKTELKHIIQDYTQKNPDKADYYYLVTGCDLSKNLIDHFNKLCEEYGLKNVVIWSASILEAILYDNYHDLLFTYFGVNMTNKRNERIDSIRRNIELKKKMHADFLKSFRNLTNAERMQLTEEPWRKFNHSEVLIRSIYDTKYPENSRLDGDLSTGYFKAEVFNFYHNGLMVFAFPYRIDAKVRDTEFIDGKEVEIITEMSLHTIGCIPFENIIAYDISGDEFYIYPHLFCDFPNGSDPFDEIRYRSKDGYWIDKDMIVEIL